LEKLSSVDIETKLLKLEKWSWDNGYISRMYKLNSFMEVMSLANLVSDKAEQIDHHPKIIIDYDCVEFRLSTHSIGGISELDFELAKFIQETFNELFV
tara:strand:+ start:241 stop:534 length:294 start_codon:yes stop_codon:yes gene_type:complete